MTELSQEGIATMSSAVKLGTGFRGIPYSDRSYCIIWTLVFEGRVFRMSPTGPTASLRLMVVRLINADRLRRVMSVFYRSNVVIV